MNRRYAALLSVFAVFCTMAAAQNVEDQIKKMEKDRAAAVVKGDVSYLDKDTSDDYSIITTYGVMGSKSQMLDGFKSGASKISREDLSDLKVHVYGNVAVITGKADIEGMLSGKDATGQVMFTRVYAKKAGRWQSVALQQTKISNP